MDIYEYIKEMNTEEELFPEMLAYAQENRVPIMDQDALSVMKHYIHLSGAKRILEIGTAIGYSAMHMLSVSQDISVVTIEKDQDSHAHAKRFFEMQGVSDRVRSLLADAKEVAPEELGEQKFDLLFIDASKGNNRNFFDKFSAHVRPGGLIIIDNILLRGLVTKEEITARGTRRMKEKVDGFNRMIKESKMSSAFLPVGDGLLIITKDKEEQGE